MRNLDKIRVFHRAHELLPRIQPVCAQLRKLGNRELAEQLRDSSRGVPANIVEGAAHSSRHEYARYLQMALATHEEARYHLRLARDQGAIAESEHSELQEETLAIRRMLASLLRVVRAELSEAGNQSAMEARDVAIRKSRVRAKEAKRRAQPAGAKKSRKP